jgi:hypothetical protein
LILRWFLAELSNQTASLTVDVRYLAFSIASPAAAAEPASWSRPTIARTPLGFLSLAHVVA